MKILLDTGDLINLVEHNRPVNLSEFRDYLVAHDATIVLTFGNVRELAAPLAARIRHPDVDLLFQKVETLPISYLGEVKLAANEVRAAVSAFNSGAEYQPIDPYVSRWDETISGSPSAASGKILGLNEIVLLVASQDSTSFAGFGNDEDQLRRQFENARLRPPSAQVPCKSFPNVVRHFIEYTGTEKPTCGIQAFARWVYDHPQRCPALRMGHDVFHHMLSNTKDIPHASDIPDWMHIKCTPYVDAITLDRRVYGYCSQVCQRIEKAHAFIDYSKRIFPNLEALVSSKPRHEPPASC
jgi:hypothetical protein